MFFTKSKFPSEWVSYVIVCKTVANPVNSAAITQLNIAIKSALFLSAKRKYPGLK